MTGIEIIHNGKQTILRSFKRHVFEEMPFVDCFVKVEKKVDSDMNFTKRVFNEDLEIINKWCDWLDYKKVPYVMLENTRGMELWKQQIIFDFDAKEQIPPSIGSK